MLLEAVRQTCDELRILFFVPPHLAATDPTTVSKNLLSTWGLDASIQLAPLRTRQQPSSWSNTYLSPCASLFRQDPYWSISGPDQVRALNEALAWRPGYVMAHRLSAACPLMLTDHSLPIWFLDLDDVEHLKFLRELRQPPYWIGKLMHTLQAPALCLGERRAACSASLSFVCSERDQRYLSKVLHVPSATVVPNAVKIPQEFTPIRHTKQVVFIGSFSYTPNIRAAEILLRKVWPSVLEAVPDACLKIVGNLPERIPSYLSPGSRVQITGFAPDLGVIYSNAQVVCCPIASGGGTRLKIVEACAHGRPVVTTAIGAEGLSFSADHEIIIQRTTKGLAASCIELLENPDRCELIGRHARHKAAMHHDRTRLTSSTAAVISSALASHHRG
jgi:glycosyltransferase involved in cell wall biosynthesis